MEYVPNSRKGLHIQRQLMDQGGEEDEYSSDQVKQLKQPEI